jgi:AcrR family transcriptional regulator
MVAMTSSTVKGEAAAPDGRSRRWQEHKLARRHEFVDAAVTAIRVDGERTGLDAICAVAGVSKPVIYRHFRDKADLFRAVLHQIASEIFLPRIAAELDPEQGDEEILRAAIGAYVGLVSEEPQLYRFVFAHNALGERGDFVASMEDAVAQALVGLISRRLAEAGRPSFAAEPWAYGIVGMVQLATHRWVDRQTASQDELVELLVSLAWQGLMQVAPEEPSETSRHTRLL